VSTGRIVWAAWKPALAVVLVSLALGEYVVAHTERIARTEKVRAQGAQAALSTRAGFCRREGHTFMHFNAVEPKGVLHGVTLFEFDQNRWLSRSTFAKRAIYQRGEWLLMDVVQTELERDRTQRLEHDVLPWEIHLSPEVLGVLVVKPETLS